MAELAQVIVPAKFPNDEKVIITAQRAQKGDPVKIGSPLLDVEFSKATVELESPADGFAFILFSEGDEVAVGDVVALIFSSQSEAMSFVPLAPVRSKAVGKPETKTTGQKSKVRKPTSEERVSAPNESSGITVGTVPVFSKDAEKAIEAAGIDRESFNGRAFVRSVDVLAYLSQASGAGIPSSANMPTGGTPFSALAMSPLKRAESNNLLGGQNNVTSNFQKSILVPRSAAREGGAFGGLDSTVAVLRVCCELLKKFKYLNAFLSDGALHCYDQVQMGYAIDLGMGLRVLNLGDVSELSDKDIRVNIAAGVKAYLMGKTELMGSEKVTFTVTDLSNEGVEYFIPLIGRFQSGTLGICSAEQATGQFKVSLTFDHRVTEGRVAATFLRELADNVGKYLAP